MYICILECMYVAWYVVMCGCIAVHTKLGICCTLRGQGSLCNLSCGTMLKFGMGFGSDFGMHRLWRPARSGPNQVSDIYNGFRGGCTQGRTSAPLVSSYTI
jgi:hypothetical protein